MTSPNANIEAIYPVTPVQNGILFHTLYAPDSPLYIQQYTCRFDGDLDVAAFTAAWQHVIDRHAPLRSLLTWEGRDQPLQIVRRTVTPDWKLEDWRDRADSDEALEEFLERDRSAGFALDEAPLMRFALFHIADDAHRFVWSHHHIVVDGWSLGLVLAEVFAAYEAITAGAEPALPAAPPYRDYVRWLKAYDTAPAEAFWRRELDGFTSPTPLAMQEQPAAERWAERHAELTVRMTTGATDRLTEFARAAGLTVNTVMRGAWALVLSRYSGTDDVVFGATLAGRPPELEGSLEMVGLFINTLPVRIGVAPDATVADWLRSIQEWQVRAVPFESTPLVQVQAWSEILAGEPIFESLLAFENVPVSQAVTPSLATSDVRYLQRSNYPLAVLVLPGAEYELTFLYDVDRFHAEVVERMAHQLLHVLDEMTKAPDRPLAEVALFPAAELDEMLVSWNATRAEYPSDSTIHQLVAKAAAESPDAVAVVGPAGSLSYGELMARAEVVADQVRGLGVGRGDRVGICLDRSPAVIVALLGVVRAGAAYVPLDPGLPVDRISLLLDDTSARALIAGADTPLVSPAVPLIALNALGTPTTPRPGDSPVPESADPTPDDLAYVLYTSGSTGIPKGVAVTHRNLVNSTHARLDVYGGPVSTFLLLSPFIFDSSVVGIFSTLTQGGTLVLPGSRMEQDVNHLAELIATHRVTHTLALPTLYGLLLELAEPAKLDSLELVMVAGEPCPPHLVSAHFAVLPNTKLANEYGPTEATVWCTVHHMTPADGVARRVPIGRPIANTQAYILDAAGRPSPVGVPGELHIGGVNLAQGYHNRPDVTAAQFVTRELPGVGTQRLYRTGDVARWRPDGTVDLLGRLDHQIKIRGQRIELGEIEMVLRTHPHVRDAVVVLDGPDVLVAYTEGADDPEVLRAHLRANLPDAMVPAHIVCLADLPRGSTGKVDRSALPETPPQAVAEPEYVAPATDLEQRLAGIWAAVLDVDRVGATDNFFSLGGDSISSIRVIAQAHKHGIAVTPKQFFDHPTVAGLASVASGAESVG